MATAATAYHYATIDPFTGALGMQEFVNQKLICAVSPDSPERGFAG